MGTDADDMDRRLGIDKTWGKPEQAAEESDDFDITKMEGCYSKLAAIGNLVCLHLVMGDGTVETAQYHHMDVKGRFKSGEFVVEFAGTKLWELRVNGFGDKLWLIYDRITRHRMRAIRQATSQEAKFAEKGDTVLTKIELVDVTPKERSAGD